MAGTIIGNNTTIKISAAVSNSRTSNGTIYTCPANSYAILNVYIAVPADSITVGGNIIATGATNGVWTIHVGPSQALVTNHSASNIINVSGVEFTNSP